MVAGVEYREKGNINEIRRSWFIQRCEGADARGECVGALPG